MAAQDETHVGAPVQRSRTRFGKDRFGDLSVAFWFLLPSGLGLFMFLVFPLFASLALSFTNWTLIGEARFIGFRNFVRVFTTDPIFWTVLWNTILFTVEYLVLNLITALGLAVWISSLRWGRHFFRLIFFLPTFTPLIGASVVWLLIFTPGGVLDWLFKTIGLPIGNIIVQPEYAMQAVIIVSIWGHMGYNLMLFGAALESIPKHYLEAAEVDGANAWQRFWKVKLPLISPTLFFGTVMTAITSLQVFDQVFALTNGGPGSATATLGFHIYTTGFGVYRMGYASSMAWILFAMIMALTAVQLRLQHRWVHYDQ